MVNIAIFISGSGSNMKALIEESLQPKCPANVAFILSDNPEALGVSKAQSYDIPVIILEKKKHETKSDHEEKIKRELLKYEIDYVFLAGFMRLLSSDFCQAWHRKIINIHPSLLPAFKGLNTHGRAIEMGVKFVGCTVHFVTEQMDDGPIIAQAGLCIHSGDTPETLQKRVLKLEHRLYPKILYNIAGQGDNDMSFFEV